MLDFDLIKNVLIIGIAAGIITTSLVQKLKGFVSSSKWVPVLSFFVSITVGTLFSLSFANVTLIYSLWSGLFAFIGADMLYQAFEEKIFTPFADLNQTITIKRDDTDEYN